MTIRVDEMGTSKRLKDKVVVVTGGASGIGAATVRRLAAECARLAIFDLDHEAASVLAAEISGEAIAVSVDVTSERAWQDAVGEVHRTFGALDVLVNCAGGGRGGGRLVDEDALVHRRIIDLNLESVWHGIRAVHPLMAPSGGSIVNVSSIDGLVGASGAASYVAAKFAVTGVTKAAALELGAAGIRVNAVHPGFVETPLLAGRDATLRRALEKAASSQPIPRFARPEEIAGAILFFASDDSSFCTGSSLVVDGGKIAGSR
ncbi:MULTISPECIES: SDR family oxidoreductase [Microbacterium]|uniref:SDR family NAD(P)-dependent oxidoreductase n=1 Tax=Microbacterium TaxID=33882 RepID=UPI000D644F13|nr:MULTISPECIES: SDR family oxidoreductase [Microbacterium]